MGKTLGKKSKFTIEDYPDRKYNIGQKVYVIRYEGANVGIHPPESIILKPYTIKDMALSSLNTKLHPDSNPQKFGYAYKVEEDSFEVIFEKTSYGSLEEALKALDNAIELQYNAELKKVANLAELVNLRYREWKNYSDDVKETLGENKEPN